MHTQSEMSSNVPAFLAKLWRLVEDATTDELICWNDNGTSFLIKNQSHFARELLPLYYKHNNMASFVRQLNMYGFHKIVSVESGGLKTERDDMEFAHVFFIRGQPYLLENIKRKLPASKQEDTRQGHQLVVSRVLTDVKQLKGKQESMDTKLSNMKKENEALWKELATLRQKHAQQQQIVNRMIQFLVTMMQQNRGLGIKRRFPRMINSGTLEDGKRPKLTRGYARSDRESSTSPGPVISEVTDVLDSLLPCQDAGEERLAASSVLDPITDPLLTIENPHLDQSILPEVGSPEGMVHSPDNTATSADAVSAAQSTSVTAIPVHIVGDEELTDILDGPEIMMTADPEEVIPTPRSQAVDEDVNTQQENLSVPVLQFMDTVASTLAQPEAPLNDGATVSQEGTSSQEQLEANSQTCMSLMGVPLTEKERANLGNHVVDMEMELDNLKNLLKKQSSSMDMSALLGVRPSPMQDAQNDELTKLFDAEDSFSLVPDLSSRDEEEATTTGTELACNNPTLFELMDDNNQFFSDGNLIDSLSINPLLTEEDGFLSPMPDNSNSGQNESGTLDTPTVSSAGPPVFISASKRKKV